MQNFVKNFLIVYGTKSRRVEYRSRKFPRLFLQWKAGKDGFQTRINLFKKKIIDKRFVKKQYFMRIARLYSAEVQNFRFFQ